MKELAHTFHITLYVLVSINYYSNSPSSQKSGVRMLIEEGRAGEITF